MHKPSAGPPTSWGVSELLDRYPGLALRPTQQDGSLVIAGDLDFSASDAAGDHLVRDTFVVSLYVPAAFPRELAVIRETGGRVPRSFHTNPNRTLCLGSPLKLMMELSRRPDLIGFVEACVVPYFYNLVRHQSGEALPSGELKHGIPGLLDEYRELLNARDNATCIALMVILGLRKNVGNKRQCPCGSGKRVGRCHNVVLNRLRPVATPTWFRSHAVELAERA